MIRVEKGFLFLLIVLFSSWAYAGQMETVILPPKGPVQAGQQVTFSLLFTNLSGAAMNISLPDKLTCHISADGREQIVLAVPVDSKAVGSTLLPGNGFLKNNYSLELPQDASGYINFTIEAFDTSPTVFMAQAEADTPPPVVAGTAEEAVSEEKGLVDKRLEADRVNVLRAYTLMPHKPNYILLASYNSSGYNPDLFREQYNNSSIELDDTEAKFQLSIKMPLAVGLFEDKMDIFAAYTNRSFWQVYNDDISSPFRETNHEPEAWFQFRNDWQFFGIKNRVNSFGFVHQSNGQGGVLSRSWNRLYANFLFEYKDLVFGIKPWYRIQEDADDDDNPDITDFMGHFEMTGAYKWKDHTFSLMLRNNLESGFEKGTVQATWSFPLWNYPYLKGYVQWFNGYGESMIDYNQHSNSIGIGFALSDFL
jgi:phospholipase A1